MVCLTWERGSGALFFSLTVSVRLFARPQISESRLEKSVNTTSEYTYSVLLSEVGAPRAANSDSAPFLITSWADGAGNWEGGRR